VKIPVWLAIILVGAMLTGVGAAVDRLSNKMDDMQKDIVVLKVEVAEVKTRLSPQTSGIKAPDSSGLAHNAPPLDWLLP
jgi:hypothetical protein